jgi:hypothetical protein
LIFKQACTGLAVLIAASISGLAKNKSILKPTYCWDCCHITVQPLSAEQSYSSIAGYKNYLVHFWPRWYLFQLSIRGYTFMLYFTRVPFKNLTQI